VNVSDETLMADVGGGDLRKLAVLFERHNRPLYNFFLHMNGNADLSEDLVQDVFFRMLRYRHTYDQKRSFTGWMYQIARNAAIDMAHKRRGGKLAPGWFVETGYGYQTGVPRRGDILEHNHIIEVVIRSEAPFRRLGSSTRAIFQR
jgi:RNA polymerase sigma factor (sigma-70 family)